MKNNHIRKYLVIVIIILFAELSITSPVTSFSTNNSGKSNTETIIKPIHSGVTIYVDDDNTEGPWYGTKVHPYQYISDALNNSTDGDTIFVYNGYYYEGVRIHNQIKLIGENKYTTVIEAERRHKAIALYNDYITISGFTINNTDNWANDCGIQIQNAWGTHTTHNTITENIFTNHRTEAITIYQSKNNIISHNIIKSGGINIGSFNSYNDISNNTFINCGINVWGVPKYTLISNNHITNGGIKILGGSSNIVSDNDITDGSDIKILEGTNYIVENNILMSSGSIFLDKSSYITVGSNTFSDSRGIYLDNGKIQYLNTHTIEDNIVNGRPIYYYKNEDGIKVPSNSGQVILVNCTNCNIENLSIDEVFCGIHMIFSSTSTITNCSIYSTEFFGIKLYGSSYNIIKNNIIESNKGIGIQLGGSNTIIEKNRIISNMDGIRLGGSCSSINISYNIIENNEWYGVYLDGKNIEIYKNIFEKNRIGLWVAAVDIDVYKNNFEKNKVGLWLVGSYDTLIYKNNFIRNVRFGSFSVDHTKLKKNKWQSNYYGFTLGLFPKLILGLIISRFYWEDMWGYKFYLPLPAFIFDKTPAKIPYDLEI